MALAFAARTSFAPLTAPAELSAQRVLLASDRLVAPAQLALPSSRPRQAPLEISASKKLQGTVINNMRDKTVAVEVKRIAPHPLYKKRILTSKKYHVHDPENQCNVGDFVTLGKCAPVSKTKRFVVVEIRRNRVAGALRAAKDIVEEQGESALPPTMSEMEKMEGVELGA